MSGRKKIAIVVAEFFGTFALTSAVLAIVTGINIPLFTAMTAGLTLAVMVLVVGPVSGAHLNPAVTLGLWTLKKVSTSTAIVYVVTQLLAGLVALNVNEYLLDRAIPSLAEGGWDWRIVVAEALGAFVFTFGIASAVYNKYEGGRLAAAIGASLFVGVLVASFGANGILNPAVAVGLNSWSFSYAVAPLIGSVLGMNLYAQLFAPDASKSRKK